MTTCAHCEATLGLPRECEYCGDAFCVAHLLPENHDCAGVEKWETFGGRFDSGFGHPPAGVIGDPEDPASAEPSPKNGPAAAARIQSRFGAGREHARVLPGGEKFGDEDRFGKLALALLLVSVLGLAVLVVLGILDAASVVAWP